MTSPRRRPHRTYVGTREEITPQETTPASQATPASRNGHPPHPAPPSPDPAPAPPEGLPAATDRAPAEGDPPPSTGAETGQHAAGEGWLRPGGDDDPVLAVSGRFPSAHAAATYLGQLLDAVTSNVEAHRSDDGWWVTAEIRLSLARELTELNGGTLYFLDEDEPRPDRGWGPPPDPSGPSGPGTILPAPLTGQGITDLVVAAGLRRGPTRAPAHLSVLVPAARASSLLRRAADLGLQATFRAVRLRPLFAPANGGNARGGTLIQLRLQVVEATARRHLPSGMVSALDRDWQAVVLREATDDLLVQHDRQSPLTDRQLAALADGNAWVLADPPFGCWSLEPLGEFTDAASLMVLGPAQRLTPGDPALVDAGSPTALPAPIDVRVVPSRHRNAPVDAVLLRTEDLDAVRLLLEGHPLADEAFLVPGRDHHLLIAAGGIVERIPVGCYVTGLGPHPVYVPHGWRTDPVLPPSVYAALASQAPGHALVLQPTSTLVFDLGLRRPVWELWAGPLPEIDLQRPDTIDLTLVEVDRAADPWGQVSAPAPPPDEPSSRSPAPVRTLRERLLGRRGTLPGRSRQPVTWQQQALDAELAGELRRAARLHEDNGSPLKAARLYERAAHAGSGEPEH